MKPKKKFLTNEILNSNIKNNFQLVNFAIHEALSFLKEGEQLQLSEIIKDLYILSESGTLNEEIRKYAEEQS